MKKIYLSIFVLSFLLLFSCKKDRGDGQTNEEETTELSTEAEAVEVDPSIWEGEYKGMFPCDDCDGIEIAITLNFDKTFTQISRYIGKGGPYEKIGTFQFSESTSDLVLCYDGGGTALYKLAGDAITLVNRGEGEREEDYVLRR